MEEAESNVGDTVVDVKGIRPIYKPVTELIPQKDSFSGPTGALGSASFSVIIDPAHVSGERVLSLGQDAAKESFKGLFADLSGVKGALPNEAAVKSMGILK